MGVIATAKFSARVWLTEEGVESIKVWIPELYPVDPRGVRRSSEEWVEEHLGDWSREQFIDLVNCQDNPPNPLLGEGAFQLLLEGDIEGHRSFTQDGDEYDEDIQVSKVEYCVVPDDYFEQLDVIVQE